MHVASIEVVAIKPRGGLIGFASIVIENGLYLGSIAIYTRPGGSYRLLYPTKQTGLRDINIFHPINRDASKQIENAIFKKCEEIFERSNEDDRYHQNTNSSTGTS